MAEPERAPEEEVEPLRRAAVRQPTRTWGLWLANVALAVGLLGAIGPCVYVRYSSSVSVSPAEVLALSVLAVPVVLACAIVALVLSRRSPEPRRVRRRALGGLITSLVGVGAFALLFWSFHAQYGPWGNVMQFHVESDLMALDKAIEKYASEHGGVQPADLEASAEFVGDPTILFSQAASATNHQVTHYHYVVGLDDAAPAKWIRVYADPSLFGREGGAVLCVDGTVELLDEPEFGQRLKAFVDEYRAARGEEPVVIAPR